ncbi:hypothetical protein BS47DRAFT_1253186, partial [Hydnum rufescens UP504]
VNPATIEHWFKLVEAQFNQYHFEPQNIYGMDESGFPFRTGQPVKVVTRKTRKCQHIQCDGNHENVSVIVTICADGTSLPLTVIFQ